MSTGHLFSRSRIPRITDAQWTRLADYFTRARASMPHAIGNAGGMSYDLAHALILGLTSEGIAHLNILVFHRCEEHPVATRPYAAGFPRLPWACPACDREVDREGELTFELECVTPAGLRFE